MKELDMLGNFAERQAIAESALHQSAAYNLPDARGHFGPYGGSFVAETLSHACLLYTSPSPRDKRQSRMPSSA